MALGTRITAASDALFGLLFRFRFRYDLFLSYARSDGKQYALKLRDQLQALDFSCFLDQHELPPGNSLRSSLSRALRRSATLVVIGTERALQSRYVAQEIAEFAATGRAIVPIDFQGTLAEPPWSVLRERDLVWIDETREALARGVPSPAVADGIDKLFKYTRRNVRVRGQILTTVLLFLIGAALSAWIIDDKVRELDRATATAEAAEREAEKATREATRQRQLAEASEEHAVDAADRARKQEKIALANAERAQREQQRAEEKTRESQARLFAADSERSRDGTTDGLVHSVLLATESLQKTWLLEGRIALAQGLRLLPRRLQAGIPASCGIVYAAAFSSNGRWLAVGGQEGLAVFDPAESWHPRLEALRGRPVRAVAFSRDGSRLAVGVEREIHVLDPETGQTVAEIQPGEQLREDVHSLAFSPDGRYLAAATMDFQATLLEKSPDGWRVVLPAPVLDEHQRVLSLTFSPDGHWLALGGVGEIAIWDVAQRSKISREEANQVFGVAFVSGSRDLLSVGLNEIRFWRADPSTGRLSESREERISTDAGIRALALSPDERFFATWHEDRTVRLWSTSARQERSRMMLPSSDDASAIAFTPDGGRIVAGIGKTLSVWQANGSHELALLAGGNAAAFSPSGRWLAVGGAKSVRLVQVPQAVSVSTLADPASWPERARWDLADEASFVAFSPDGTWLAAATASSVQVIDTRTRRTVLRQQIAGDEDLSAVVFSPGGRWLVATTRTAIHRIATGSWREAPPIEPQESLSRLAFSPDDRWMGTQTESHYVRGEGLVRPTLTRVYEAQTGRRLAWRSHEEDDLKGFGFRKSERFEGPPVKEGGRMDLLRQAASWRELRKGKPQSATSPDGLWEVAIESWGVKLAEKGSGREIDHLAHENLSDASFSPDSRWLVTAGTGGAVKVWSLTPQDLIGQACARLAETHRLAEGAHCPPATR